MVELFDLTVSGERERWERFHSQHPEVAIVDTLAAQIAELCEIDHPEAEPHTPAGDAALAQAAAAYRERPEAAGVWVFYPWRNAAVHLLPEAAFFRVRTARNRNILTDVSQKRFRDFTVGIAGLSVGHGVAVAVARQGGSASLVLADNDSLALSNLNRIAAPLSDLGLNKAQLTARAILEINPYARLRLYPEGLQLQNMSDFFGAEPQPHVIVEAVDSFVMKWKLREMARERRIPLLMPTCMGERVLLDVERYDLLPDRKLFVRDLPADFLERVSRPMTRQEWVRAATDIVGEDDTDTVVRETNALIGSAVTTRPLLGGTVLAMSAVVSRAIRLLATGGELPDGRHVFSFR